MRAALLRNTGDEKLDVVSNASVVETAPGFVRLKIKATGVCHSDLSTMTGVIPQPAPVILGHEGAGEVVEVGDNCPDLRVGDHAIVAWVAPCGKCTFCIHGQPNLCSTVLMDAGFVQRFKVGDELVYGMAGTGTFCEEVVLPYQSVIKIPDDVPWDVASLVGCGVMTGVGAAVNAAKVQPGSSVVVFGCGGVGISIVQGARIAGAAEIVAVDLMENKREDAKRFGATHACSPEEIDVLKAELTANQGFDYTFEAIGLPVTIRAAYDAARRGGTVVVVGVGGLDQMVSFSAFELFYSEKKLMGTVYGSADVRRDFHRLIRLWKAGRLDLEGMITQKLALEDVNQALDDMKAGKVIRTVIEL
jgi:S-(hydroxymethyl)glutathione dehydrogenase/alcohol dehydrogenase